MSKVDYREILRLDSLHYSRKRISISIGSSHHTVKDLTYLYTLNCPVFRWFHGFYVSWEKIFVGKIFIYVLG